MTVSSAQQGVADALFSALLVQTCTCAAQPDVVVLFTCFVRFFLLLQLTFFPVLHVNQVLCSTFFLLGLVVQFQFNVFPHMGFCEMDGDFAVRLLLLLFTAQTAVLGPPMQ